MKMRRGISVLMFFAVILSVLTVNGQLVFPAGATEVKTEQAVLLQHTAISQKPYGTDGVSAELVSVSSDGIEVLRAAKMTVNDSNYRMAAVIGIMVFAVTAIISLAVYGILPSVKDEEGFQ